MIISSSATYPSQNLVHHGMLAIRERDQQNGNRTYWIFCTNDDWLPGDADALRSQIGHGERSAALSLWCETCQRHVPVVGFRVEDEPVIVVGPCVACGAMGRGTYIGWRDAGIYQGQYCPNCA